MPADYAAWLAEIKGRIHGERLRLVLASNSVMVLVYWDIGQRILNKQAEQGYGTKVIDRLAADLRDAFADMKGFSPRKRKYMRAFAAAWPDRELVQQTVAQLTWGQNIVLLEKLDQDQDRLWYAARTLAHGWSRNILSLQIEGQAHLRQGRAQNNFPATLPPPDSDMAAQVFKDPYPPEMQEEAIRLVLEQAERLSEEWAR
jgi:predicted nuclease of restriction endonuclease-like (RecB) superfamily